MLRAIFFLDCDFCHESHSCVRSMTDRDHATWSYVRADLEESAFDDGWCHSLMEDTGQYLLMCHACHADLSFELQQKLQNADADIDF
jgi:hypothetical protein